jgi:hypothetical protein
MNYDSSAESKEKIFKIISVYQSDTEKYKIFFKTSKAHFIHMNQVLFYDKTKKSKRGDKIFENV